MNESVQKVVKIVLIDLQKHKLYGPKLFGQEADNQFGNKTKQNDGHDSRVTLNLLKYRTTNDFYSSIFKFYLDLLQACSYSHVIGPACIQQKRKNKFKQICISAIESVFPWFDVQNTSLVSDFFYSQENKLESMNFSKERLEHSYAYTDKLTNSSDCKIFATGSSTSGDNICRRSYTSGKDTRKCQFCGQCGDHKESRSGRLLYYRQNEWVHVNCALWSSEVYEEIDGSLQNVWQALNRGAKLSCTYCGERGATIGCNHSYCDSNYHFECGLNDGAIYKDDKKVFCRKHINSKLNNSAIPKMEDLGCLRTVHIETDRDNKKLGTRKPRLFDLRKITIRIGALTIKSLGYLHTAVSDKSSSLIPVNFECTRVFWSTSNPYQRTKYHCRISLIVPKKEEAANDCHFVINHQSLPQSHFDESLQEFKQYVEQVNEKEKLAKQTEIRNKFIDEGKPVFEISLPKNEELQKIGKYLNYDVLHEDDENTKKSRNDTKTNIEGDNQMCCTKNDLKLISEKSTLDYVSNTALEKNEDLHSDFVRKPVFSPRKPMNKAVSNVVNRISPNKNNSKTASTILPDESVYSGIKHNLFCNDTPASVYRCDEAVCNDGRQELMLRKSESTVESSTCNASSDQEISLVILNETALPHSYDLYAPSDSNGQHFAETYENDARENEVILYAGSESSCSSFVDDPSNTLESLSGFTNDTVKHDVNSVEYNEIDNISSTANQNTSTTRDELSLSRGHANDADVDMAIIQNILSFSGNIPGQLDGQDDSEDAQPSSHKRSFPGAGIKENEPLQKRKKVDTQENEETITSTQLSNEFHSKSTEYSCSPSIDDSPKKDFTIAGLLSPVQENVNLLSTEIQGQSSFHKEDVKQAKKLNHLENHSDSDDDVVYLTTSEKVSQMKSTSQTKEKTLNASSIVLPQTSKIVIGVASEHNRASFGHKNDNYVPKVIDQASTNYYPLSTSSTASNSFNYIHQPILHPMSHPSNIQLGVLNQTVHKPPQHNLPYLMPDGSMHQLQNFPHATQYHQPPSTSILPPQPQFHITPPMPQAPQLTGYIAQPSIIAASPTTVASGLFQIGISPHVTTANVIHHHIHHTPANPIQAAVVQSPGSLLYNQSTHVQQVPYVLGPNNQTFTNQILSHSSSLGAAFSLSASLQQPQVISTEHLNNSILNQATFVQSNNSNQVYPPLDDQSIAGKKVARVQPQPINSKEIDNRPMINDKNKQISRSQDPLLAMSNIANQTIQDETNQSIIARSESNIPSRNRYQNEYQSHPKYQQRSVGTQAKISNPIKVISARPWKQVGDDKDSQKINQAVSCGIETEAAASSSRGSSVDISRSNSPKSPLTQSKSIDLKAYNKTFIANSCKFDRSKNQYCESLPSSLFPSNSKSLFLSPVIKPEYHHEQKSSGVQFSSGNMNRLAEDLQKGHHPAITRTSTDDFTITNKPSNSDSIEFVLQQKSQNECYEIKDISIEDGRGNPFRMEPKAAENALLKTRAVNRTKSKKNRLAILARLDGAGNVIHSNEDFVNEQNVERNGESTANRLVTEAADAFWRTELSKEKNCNSNETDEECKNPYLLYEISSDDGFRAESHDPSHLWKMVFEAVQKTRDKHRIVPLSSNPFGENGLEMLGLTHAALAFLVEQLPGVKQMQNYHFKHRKNLEKRRQEEMLHECPEGCAKAQPFTKRKAFDMFNWLANPHRKFPDNLLRSNTDNGQDWVLGDIDEGNDGEKLMPASKRATSLDLPMAMRFRHLAKNAKEAVGVFSSSIHGRGLYCKRTISAGEMVIEYAGEEIRAILTDKRERK